MAAVNREVVYTPEEVEEIFLWLYKEQWVTSDIFSRIRDRGFTEEAVKSVLSEFSGIHETMFVKPLRDMPKSMYDIYLEHVREIAKWRLKIGR